MSATKRGPGAPRKAADALKAKTLPVRMTPTERAILAQHAKAADISQGEYVRRAVAYCAARAVPMEHVMPITSTVVLSPEAMARLVELTENPPSLTAEQRAHWAEAATVHSAMLARRAAKEKKK